MAYLQRNSYFKDLSGGEVFEGQPHKIEDLEYTSLRISVQTDVSGTLTVLQSLDGYTWNEFNDTFAISSTSHKQVDVKGRYVYVMYENGASPASPFQLYSVLSKSGVSASGGVGLQEVLVVNDSLAITGMNFDASGNLKVSGISGGGVSSDVNITNPLLAVSDSSSHELLTDLSGAVWENTDRLLYDLDIIANHGTDASANAIAGNLKLDEIHTRLHDISGTVAISNQITGFATSAKQDSMLSDLDGILNRLHDVCGNVAVSNQITGFATESTLDAVATTAEDISLQLTVPQRSWVEVDFDTQSSQIVQGAGTWRVPLTGEKGWEYLNSTIGGATAYFYSNTGLVAGGLESNITLGSLTTMWFIGNYRLATAVNPNRRFYLSVYTKPQGSGDYEIWYRSSKTYQLPNSAIVSKGADVFYYAGLDISTIYKEYDHKAYELAVSRGPCASDEVIQFMSLAVDSACPANEFDGIVKHAGFSTAGGTNRVVSFTRASREKIAEDNLKSLTVQSGELQVKDASAVALLAEIANGITVQVGQVEISGVVITEISGVPVVEISGSVVADVSFPAVQMVEVSGVPVVEISGSVVADVSFPSVQVVEVSGSVLTDLSGATFTESKLNVFDASASSHLSAIEDILDTGFVNVYDASSELLLSGIKTQTDKLSFQNEGTYETLRVRVENPSSGGGVVEISGVSIDAGRLPVYDASANEPLSKLSFYADGYGAYDLRTQITNSVGVSVNNQPTVSLAAFSEVSLASGTQVALASGSQVALATGSQVQLVNSEVSLTSGSQIYANLRDNNGNAIGSALSDIGERAINSMMFAHDNANDTIERVRLGEMGGLQIENANGTKLQVDVMNTPKVEISGNMVIGDLSVNILNSSIDAHIFGSSDGTTFHHIKTNPNGVVATNAIMETDANGALTSTSVSGTETYNALHTIVKGSVAVSGISNAVSVQNNTGTQLAVKAQQYGSYGNVANNLASLLPSSATAGINVADWSYFVGYYQDFNGATTGNIRLQYSFDNITYYNLFGTTIFPSGSSPRTATIYKQDIPAINWIRLYNETSSTLTSITLTLLGGSVS